MSAHAPRYSFLPPRILKKRLLHEGDHEETQLCYQHMQRLLGYRRLPETEMMPLSYAALPESGCTSQAHRRVMHLKNLTTVPDLYYREDRKAENPQPHMHPTVQLRVGVRLCGEVTIVIVTPVVVFSPGGGHHSQRYVIPGGNGGFAVLTLSRCCGQCDRVIRIQGEFTVVILRILTGRNFNPQ